MDRIVRLWRYSSSRIIRMGTLASLFFGALAVSALPQPTPIAQAASGCMLNSAKGNIKHVISIQFDNTHFRRDNPNVPSDLEQMPHLLNFITNNGVLLANDHT
ncbi:MAG TPA: hypothetical protein VFS83_16075, partial [Ktedonobacterales bacterium]|nr:hypothetical protein [Ktedonobacterales bacterium]